MADDAPVFTVSQAAELAGMHPQTLRQYDRLGLVVARRTRGRGRRYSLRDVARLRQVQELAQGEGVNLAGIKRILDLQAHVSMLEERLEEALVQLQQTGRVFAAGTSGDVVVVPRGRRVRRGEIHVEETVVERGEGVRRSRTSGALVLWRPHRGDRG
ncbi:MerR family transcriptional regulator/heat shock protein HspR [Myceligenerans xiligouense]|uniref:MerR family transcriptional regulator/heat shock protein HspR n=2 Tax=Myceligenerans xiligouense TaxID=253184 RepID=A0A3N4YK28_9MICO|nr:MerR family transcriptional regulator [Myceligenerans xiligouense]RPF19654.1 MerR family transcriptional regulator/heat shock protein HspR [Myceligenerans xiligouense]